MNQIPCIDMEEALRRLMGNEALLLRVLCSFVQEFNSRSPAIETHIANLEFDQAILWFHTIKGMASNVAATAIYDCCYLAEANCQSGNLENIQKSFTALRRHMTSLEQALPIQGSHI